MSTHWVVWDKLNTMPSFGDCELIWTSSERKSVKKETIEYNGLLGKEEIRVHPTQKPVRLLRLLIADYSNSADTILDPFMGSGTTLRAAKDLRRKAIGIEIEEKYAEIAARRLEQEVIDFPYDEKQRTSVSLSVLEKVAAQEHAIQTPVLFDLPIPIQAKKQRAKKV